MNDFISLRIFAKYNMMIALATITHLKANPHNMGSKSKIISV